MSAAPVPRLPLPAPATPPPAPAGAQWIDVDEAAKRSGWNKGHVARLCRKEWGAAGLAKVERPAGGGKGRWMIRTDADPALARVQFPEAMAFDQATLSERHRLLLADRLRIYKEWRRAVETAPG